MIMVIAVVAMAAVVAVAAIAMPVQAPVRPRPVPKPVVTHPTYVEGTPFPARLNHGFIGIPDDPYGSRFASRRSSDIPPPPFQYPTPRGAILQVGILTAEGGSANSAAPDRTILPLFGRELDSRRGRWNYYTRTDGTNPVQVPVRVGNRLCDDDTNGCNEVYSDDSVHVPALGRSFKTTVYRSSF
jgi:hypothetical protein